MALILREFQKRLLGILLDKYEASKTFWGGNRVLQSFSEKPGKILAAYDSDYADLDQIQDFESQMDEMENHGLIKILRGSRGIEKLMAVPEAWDRYYSLLEREDRRTLQNKQIELYQSYLGIHLVLDSFCQEQIKRLEENKKPLHEREEAERILELCSFILTNQQEILERELSIAVLKDSKLWEQKYRSGVCRLLRQHGDCENLLMGMTTEMPAEVGRAVGVDREDTREMERVLLEEHLVFSNPSYVYFKGNAVFHFRDGRKTETYSNMPLAFSSDILKDLEKVQILDRQVMTVENLTSFNRMKREDTFLVFLSGYHNSAKQNLMRKIYDENAGLCWKHFGDMDPDGFYILEHLRRGTGIDFEPVYMGKNELEKYREFGKPLTENDRKKAEQLLRNEKYVDIVKYMLDENVKLEQEIISWMEG